MKKTIKMLVVVLAMLMLAGCGKDDEPTTQDMGSYMIDKVNESQDVVDDFNKQQQEKFGNTDLDQE